MDIFGSVYLYTVYIHAYIYVYVCKHRLSTVSNHVMIADQICGKKKRKDRCLYVCRLMLCVKFCISYIKTVGKRHFRLILTFFLRVLVSKAIVDHCDRCPPLQPSTISGLAIHKCCCDRCLLIISITRRHGAVAAFATCKQEITGLSCHLGLICAVALFSSARHFTHICAPSQPRSKWVPSRTCRKGLHILIISVHQKWQVYCKLPGQLRWLMKEQVPCEVAWNSALH